MTITDLPVRMLCDCGEGARLVQDGEEPMMCMDFRLSVKIPLLQLLKSLTTLNEAPPESKNITQAVAEPPECTWEDGFDRMPGFQDYASQAMWTPCPEISCLEDKEGLQGIGFSPLPAPCRVELTHANQDVKSRTSPYPSHRSIPERRDRVETPDPKAQVITPGPVSPLKPRGPPSGVHPDTCLQT
ncbi:unnamed protein product [Effrenium voratum]|uniref:Uncharacterized protein n=1 Tax=Effrenium voratum TaxID=2562239 RepID=A0AA36I5E8_9DINO|nr:unnamed protein product [Effrenium voratum]CAJ1380455.1 unnamed protein product [Effrenium voratum]CAJ1453169.1 unnamed protein product [Effrenium voratum]